MIGINGKVTLKDLDAGFAGQLEKIMDAVAENLQATAQLVRDDAKATASFIDRTGNLRQSIRMRKSKYKDGGYIVIATGRNRSDTKGFHAHLVEFGHVKVAWGRRPGGRVAARPFMRPALAKGYNHALSLFKK